MLAPPVFMGHAENIIFTIADLGGSIEVSVLGSHPHIDDIR